MNIVAGRDRSVAPGSNGLEHASVFCCVFAKCRLDFRIAATRIHASFDYPPGYLFLHGTVKNEGLLRDRDRLQNISAAGLLALSLRKCGS